MWMNRARHPAVNATTITRRLRSTGIRPTAALGRRHYARNEREALETESRPPSRKWFWNSLGLAGTATAAFLVYSYATKPDDSEFLKSLPSSSKSIEDLSTQYVQKKRSLKSPGLFIWGTNEYKVVDPESKESVIKTPRRLSYFDKHVLRDLKLGETSGAAIIENGDLVQWGKGYSETDFKPTKTLTGKNLKSLSMSHDRIIALSSDGTVYSLPISRHDQTSGRKGEEKSWVPYWNGKANLSYRLIQPSLKLGEKVTAISGGLEHVLLLTSSGRVFSAAASSENYPSFGQLGVAGLTWATKPQGPVDAPHEVKTPNGARVSQIAAGDYHSLLLTKYGDVLAFGDNSFGQLGMGFDPASPFRDTPAHVLIRSLYRDGANLAQATGVAAGGANSFFTVDVQEPGPTQDLKGAGKVHSDIWTCGRGIWGALGNGKWTHLQDRPSKLKALSGLVEYDEAIQGLSPIRLNDISVGTTHVSAVLGNQTHLNRASTSSLDKVEEAGLDVVWWGGNEHFQLGTGKRSNLSKPTHINIAPEVASEDDKELGRLQILPGHRRTVGSKCVNMRQRQPIMPRENQKRGRRATEKAKKEESKRTRDEAPEGSATKRLKPSTDEQENENAITAGADYIPLGVDEEQEGGQHDGRPDEMPFYGLLDPEEQEYFSRANEMLELNQFGDAEERRLFVDSVFREARGKELKIACSQSCSRLMEKLISVSDIMQIRRLFNKFIGHFLALVQHRFASHCCERLFISAAPGVTQKVSKAKAKQDENVEMEDDDEPEPELSLAEMFMTVVEELQGNWGYLLTERFASHTIRVLLLVLAGEPVDVSSNDSVVASRKKERLEVIGGETQEVIPTGEKRSVPESFDTTLKKVMQDMVSVLDDTYLRALATHPVGNPVLQVLVKLELSHFGKSSAKQSNSIIKRLIPDANFEEDSESARFIRGLLYDNVGSRLLETMVRWIPGKMFKTLYKNYLRDQMSSLARNQTAGYVVLRVLERLGKDDLQAVVEQIVPKIPGLIERSRTIVPKVLIERCLARGVDTKPLAKALGASYVSDPARRLEQMLRLETATADNEKSDPAKNGPSPDSNPASSVAEKLHGSLLAQTILTAPGQLSELVFSSLLALSSETLLSICKNPTASRVVQQALTSSASTPQFRRQFTTRFMGHLNELALDSSGSHVVDALWPATKDIYFIKERMAQELTQNELALRDSFVGRAVWRNWSMDLYKRRRGEWAAKAKGRDFSSNESGEKPKSRLELARARYAAKQNEVSTVEDLLIPFIRSADNDTLGPKAQKNGIDSNGTNGDHSIVGTSLVDYKKPEELRDILQLKLPDQGTGQDGLIDVLRNILRYSVNTWHQGFLDKLYASTNAPGVASELILAALNTNVHVYQVSPALSIIEKHTGQQLAALFGLNGPRAGGISVQGGSASNTTSIVIARNNLYPSTKTDGNGDYKFVLFTSAHGHYSIEKAAQMLGLGSSAVWAVPIDKEGRMIPSELEKLVEKALGEKRTPFYVNATAGTTVMGSFDPFNEIAAICKKHNLWLHIDGSWGGSFAFSQRQRHKLAGAEKANSIAINPHKMLGVPVTCSFLLASDLRQFHRANTLPAGYLFHNDNDESAAPPATQSETALEGPSELAPDSPEIWDLADLTLQCGRRADSLKLFLSWTYYGTFGYERQIDTACDTAAYLATLIQDNPDFILVSQNPPPCLQVCFYYAPGDSLLRPRSAGVVSDETARAKANSKVTEQITHAIVSRGFMVDYAPPSGDEEAVGDGKFFRCVVNVQTSRETVEGLVRAIEEVGPGVVEGLKAESASGPKRVPGERGHGPVVHHV
ncbi:uncharacterized protein BDV17DRAFT_284774 [Aspergillus undulatus]|uniref:uncharacterized protein n=1 Tax=Aspergillus undulatus TaxID=1810928 RepID=UPI003CCCDD23